MLIVHHLNNSRSHRIVWLLEELGLDYEIKHYTRDATTRRAPAELKAVHPLGKAPVLSDGDRVIAESGAIIDYVIRRHGDGRLMPEPGSEAYEDYVEWLHYAEGSAMFPLLMKLFTGLLGEGGAPLQPIIDQEIALHLSYMDAHLADHDFFAGDAFSGADIQMFFIAEAASVRAGLDDYPALKGFLERMHARKAYKRAIERGGELHLMGGADD